MANDELMRLVRNIEAAIEPVVMESGRYRLMTRTQQARAIVLLRKAKVEIEALAQRAPQHGAVPEGWREEILVNIKRACVRGRSSAGIPDTPMASSYVATCDHIESLADQALAAAPAPDHSADAWKMVGKTVLDREYVEITHAKSRNWQGQISVNASALAELCRVYLAQLNAPEAERAKGEAVCERCGARSDEEAETLCIPDGDDCPGNLLFDPELSGNAPPPAGQPEGDTPAPGTYWRDPKTGRLWSEVDVRFEGKNTIDWERVVVGGKPDDVDVEELAKWCDDQSADPDNAEGAVTLLVIAQTLRRLASAQRAEIGRPGWRDGGRSAFDMIAEQEAGQRAGKDGA